MHFVSSRNSVIVSDAHHAIIQGLASDGGLFVPESLDVHFDMESMKGKTYQEIAVMILSKYLNDFTEEEIKHCVYSAYDSKFDSDQIVPLTPFDDGYFMELYHGPTSAFKDVALTILPYLLTTAYQKENLNDTIAILTATSGDTGKAALSGFADVPNTNVTVFYPEDGVSDIQKAQMQTSIGQNVEVIAVKGNFDDCQRMVKQACTDETVKNACKHVTISSANSINVGRLVPQIVYYFTSYHQLVAQGKINLGDKVNFVVPTGNFGDILAGYFAKKAGLPVNKLICASNDNNVLTDFLSTGTYSTKRTFHLTNSPSMDILISSNLERLLYLASNGNSELVAKYMNDLKETGSYTISEELLNTIQSDFDGYWTSQQDCMNTIKELYDNQKILIDTHTAVAAHAMKQYKESTNDKTLCIVLSTASPFKFSQSVLESITSERLEDDFEAMAKLSALTNETVPHGLAVLKQLPIRFTKSIEVSDGISFITEKMKGLSHD